MEHNETEQKLIDLLEKAEKREKEILAASTLKEASTDSKTISDIQADVKVLKTNVDYLIRVIRDGTDPITIQIVNHEGRLKQLEDSQRNSEDQERSEKGWKITAIVSILGAVLSSLIAYFKIK